MSADDWGDAPSQPGPIEHDVLQGSDEWLELRRGKITASEMCLLMTPTWKPANNDKSRAHLYELLAQRITGFVEPRHMSDDMARGHNDEPLARALYSERYAPVRQVGFITREVEAGCVIGYSPDGMVGDDGQIEIKSRRPKYQVQTVLDVGRGITVPADYVLQIQTGLLVTGRAWCDFVSYSGGLPMVVSRLHQDASMIAAIIEASVGAEVQIARMAREYAATVETKGWPMTERTVESSEEITLYGEAT